MRCTSFTAAQRFVARLVIIALLNQWTVTAAFAGQPQNPDEPAPLPLASTVTAISGGQTRTFTDATLIGQDPSELIGKWIRVFPDDKPAGLITQITAFDSTTGTITLLDPLPAGSVAVNDVYQVADTRDVLLPTGVNPATIGLGSIGCTPAGTNQADNITCFAIDTTGADAGKGNDVVAVTSPTVVLVTKFGPDTNGSASGTGNETKTDATAISLGEGDDRIVNDGTVVAAAIALESQAPKTNPSGKLTGQQDDPKAAATAEAEAAGINAGDGQNVVTNNGTLSTSATALVLARQIPDDGKEQKSGDVSSTATATSTALETGDDGSFITNTGRLVSRAIAGAAGVGMSTSSQGAAGPSSSTSPNNFTLKSDVKATATATGVSAGSGNDTVTNTDEIVVTASAVTLNAAATQIQTQGKATATATSESTTTAQGIALGDGNDTLINSGTLTTDATSRAVSIALGIADTNNASAPGSGSQNPGNSGSTPGSKELSSTVDASATAKAEATGIVADTGEATPGGEPDFKLGSGNLTVSRETTETRAGGNDSVTNSGTIGVNATSRTVANAGGVTLDGNASVNVTSKAEASAVGVDLGAGNDSLNNSGTISSVADAAATALAIAVAQKATSSSGPPPPGNSGGGGNTPQASSPIAIETAVEGSATATSTAVGITADGALSTSDDKWTATANLNRQLDFNRQTQVTQASGTDTVTNSGAIGAVATSTTRAGSVGISADGASTVKATSTADAGARTIDLGAGNDTLTNTAAGQLTANATAAADALSLAVGFKTDPSVKAEVQSAATVETNATARATGVSADGVEADSLQTIKLAASPSQLSIEVTRTTTIGSGDDVVTNNGAITTTATATSNAIGIAASTDGKATVDATSAATAESGAIDLGRGRDTLTNTGAVTAVAGATANALGIAVGVTTGGTSPPPGGGSNPPATPPALESTANASASANAAAVGISADSLSAEVDRRLQLQIGGGPTFITVSETTTRPGGDDTVTNSGAVDVTASATSGALGVSVTTDGKAAAKLTSTAEADAAGIDLGGGNDTLTNTGGTVTATADAIARALSAAIGVKSDPNAKSTAESAADASVDATARSVGIAADALKSDSTIGLTIQHLQGVLSLSGQGTLTRPAGDDTVTNAAAITATATATSRELGVGVAIDGTTTAKTSSTATAEAAGIDLGGGNDTLVANTGDVTAAATATANALGLAVGIQGSSGGSGSGGSGGTGQGSPTPTASDTKAAVDGSVQAEATAVGVAADSLRTDTTVNASLSLPQLRPQLHFDLTQTRASGDDTLTNDGAIAATAIASSRAIGVGASVGGDATVKTTSEASAAAVGIELGGGHDALTNNGQVTATSDAVAQALNVALVVKPDGSSGGSGSNQTPQRAKSSVDASATAESRATGLAADSTRGDTQLTVDLAVGDSLSQGVVFGFLQRETHASGDDRVINTADVQANASATTIAAGIALNAEGAASARTSSTAEATATAIDLGGGADFLSTAGTLKAFATAISGGVNVALTNKGTSTSSQGFFAASEGLWKGGIDAKATAIGIDGAGAADKSTSLDIALSGTIGVDVRFKKLEDGVTADAADLIVNRGNIDAAATSIAGSLNVAASTEGSAAAVSDVESEARATGIQGGQGDDVIDNLGTGGITLVTANALTAGATVAVSGKGLSVAADTLWSSGTKAEATAIGINGDGGLLKLKGITFLGTQLTIEKTEAGATGNDVITNEQTIFSLADSTVPSLGVSYEAKKGVAATLSSVEATAAATGIRGGGGDDRITNSGQLFTAASALALAANIAIAKTGVAAAGGAIWDGGTKAEATAVGIDADGVASSSKKTTMTVGPGGVSIVHEKLEDTVAGAGADTVTNVAGVTVLASAESDTAAVAGTTKGVSAAFGQSTAEAAAAAIRGGAGNDTITNSGALDVTALSIARALNVSVETTGGVAIAGNGVWDGGTTADARATGIAGDGGSTKTTRTTISIGGGDLIDKTKAEAAATGDDTLVNTAQVGVVADATTRALSAAVPIKGLGISISTSTAEATAAAIDAGGGTDSVINTGQLTSTANATATTANVAVTKAGVAVAADAVWDGGTTARSTANGITAGEGQATVNNHGTIDVNSNSTTLSGSVAVAVSGVAAATATSTATARAGGIELGDSAALDTLTNTGAVTVNARALAGTAAVSVSNAGLAVAADSVWNGGTTATAVARGISALGGPDTVLNGGRIEAGATAATGSATVAVAVSGVAAALGTATGRADVSAIDLGAGADLLINRGQLITDALALAGTVNVSVTTAGVAAAGNDVWDGGTKAEAVARTLFAGSGDDVVVNAGDVSANSDATTVAVPVSVAISGVGVGIGTSTATSVATAIDGGDGNDTVTNRNAGIPDRTGTLVADATANAVTATVAFTTGGVAGASDAVWDGGTTGHAVARGIRTSAGGNDTIDNDGAIQATSTARSGSASVAIAVAGVAVALANSTALSNAAAIDTAARPEDAHFAGADNDTVVNRGALTVNANALALSVPVSVSGAGPAVAGNSVWDGGTTADARAKGITTGGGDDVIANSGAILADADATSGSAAVSVAVAGFAASVATSTAKAEASAIDAGAGADRITNTGKLTGDTQALAGTVTVAVTPAGVAVAGDAVWDGGTKAEAVTQTLAAGDGGDRVRNVGDVNATSVADTASVAVSVAAAGVGVTSATSTATSNATAIDLGAGDDTLVNMNGGQIDRSGKLTADATANAVAASVTVTPAGVAIASDAVWNGGTTATASAAGVDGGKGADVVLNTADVDVDSTARTGSVSAAVTVYGVSAALVNSTANATGAGITTGANIRDDNGAPVDPDLATENDVVVNSGTLVVDVDALATSLGIGFSFGGFSAAANALWDGGTTANAWASGIGLGNGADMVTNDGLIDIATFANAVAASFGITVFGVSAAGSTATGNAFSTALDGGDGNDTIFNLAAGILASDATATARGASVGFVAIGASVAGDTAWNGGTKANAVARGADGGLGDDILANDGTIGATADSTALSVAVTITGIGVGGGIATSTSTATATGVDGGDGSDTITNGGDATATALSTATGVAVTATGVGAGAAFDAFFNGGTQAISTATGLAGGAGNDVISHTAKTVTAAASSDAHSTSVAVTLVGLAAGSAASAATARAAAVDGGAGDDTIIADSALVSNATAAAAGNSIAVSSLSAIAGAFDSATRAESVAAGVAGGDGSDTIVMTDTATTSFTSNATTRDTAVSVTTAIVGVSDSQAVSTARGTGIAGDAGNDTVSQSGSVTGLLTAESKARAVTVNWAGPVAMGDVSSRSEVIGSGIDGGTGDDAIVNGGTIQLTGTATARGNAVSVIGTGASNAAAIGVSDASLTALQGGDGADTVVNAIGGAASVDATAQTFANGVSFSLIVGGTTDTQSTPTATATGLDGGAGNDDVVNNGSTIAQAHALSSATGSSINVVGQASTRAGTEATANATGLFGGLGDDLVHNRSLVRAVGISEASVNDSSWALGGGSNNSSLFNATGLSAGMRGGAGADQLVNEAFVDAVFTSTLRATGGSKAIFGRANTNTQLTAGGGAIGIGGDADDDAIWNLQTGRVDVQATADVGATRATVSFAGSPTNAALLSAYATATGLSGESGSNWLRNDGTITVRATGLSNISGGAEATVVGSTKSNGAGTADALAHGIHVDDGDNDATNAGLIDILARGDAVTTNTSSSGLLFSTGTAKADARSTVDASGIAAGVGNNILTNDIGATLIVKADASGYANAYASGSHVSIQGAATTTADSLAVSNAVGIGALGGANTIRNRGTLSVLATAGTTRDITRTDTFCSTQVVTTTDAEGNQVKTEVFDCQDQVIPISSSPTYAAANGNGVNGIGRATSTATARATAFGVQTGDGSNGIENFGDLNVTARPDARAIAFADGDLLAEAFGTARGTATATAVGIRAGAGDNRILNAGSLTVLAEPTVRLNVDVTTAAPVCINYFFGTWCGDGGIGTATANAAMTANATGIQVGGGRNLIVNDGTLSVTAAPTTADAISIAHADNRNESTTINASAVGIVTGNGDNTIVNTDLGVINVAARFPQACSGSCSLSLSSVGIQSGSGDDTIQNDGTLTATIVNSSGTHFTTAIDAGAGDDRVVLGPNSQTAGGVLLGTGNDRLVWGAGASLTGGTVAPGAGFNTFALGGHVDGTLNLAGAGPIGGINIFTSFDDFRKEGPSTWTLTGTRNMNWTVEDGTLAVAGALTGTAATAAGTVLNPTIAVTPTGSVTSLGLSPAIQLHTGGTLVNDGQVTGGATGVELSGINGLLVNNSTITAAGVGVHSIGGLGSIANEGLINAGGTAVMLGGAGDVLMNTGTIRSATGVAVQGASGSQEVTNLGSLEGGAGVALDLGDGDDTLSIVAASLFNGVSNGGNGTDTLVLGGTTGVFDLSAVGTFNSFEQTVMQASLWTLVGAGTIDVTVKQGLLNVEGQVRGTISTAASDGAQAAVLVGSTGSITGDGADAAVVLRGPDTVVNAGRLDGAIAAQGHGSSIINVGTIASRNGAAIAGGDGAQTVENDGLIIGGAGTAVDLGGGDDVLRLGAAAGFGGGVQGGAGFDTLALVGGGSARIDLGGFEAFEMMRKEDAGLRIVTGPSAMSWDIAAGALVVSGSLTGQGSIQPGALLAGNGQVGSLTNAGIVSPGMSIGSITVAGDYTQTGTGVLQVEGSIGGFSDRLFISGGATLGGTIEMVPESRPFGIATEYTVLEVEQGVTGTFDAATSTAANLDAFVDYLPKSVTVALVRNDISFAGMSGSANLQALGRSLDGSKRAMARGDFKAVMDEFLAMDAGAQASALKALSGELHASLPTTLMRAGERFVSASATRRVNAEQQAGERVTLWTDYLRFNGGVRGHDDFSGIAYGTTGLVGGVDFAIGRAARLGGSFGYARGDSELDGMATGSARVRSRMPAVYGEYGAGPVLLEGAFGYGDHAIRTARQIAVGSVHRQAFAQYAADQYSGLLRVSVRVPVRRALSVAPFVETRHSRVTRRAFDETGAESLNLAGVDAFTTSSLNTLVGVRTSSVSRLFGARVEPTLSLAWTREGQDLRSGMRAALGGMTTRPGFQPFALSGVADSRNGALLDAGASVAIANYGRAFVAYDGLLTGWRTEHSLATGLRLAW